MVKSDDGKNDNIKGEFMDTDLSVNLTQKNRRPSHPNSSSNAKHIEMHKTIEKDLKSGKYSGLSNQGATCYLNSLLQTLFMTPEFRINILKWKYDPVLHGPKEDCIPYQLQKLFARLYLKVRTVEETKDLTKSFQWTSSETWEQHDIQELCRVLFEAIEMSLDPMDKNFINELYEGNTISIVKCQECNFMSQRYDKFLDLSIPIRNEFDKIYNKSLSMAICNFLKPEVLSKDNKYECEKCCKKVDALKYSKFSKLPKILLISMMRFDYDIMTYQRKKINDKVTFPILLNFNQYLKDHKEINYDSKVEENDEECLFLTEKVQPDEERNVNEIDSENVNCSDLKLTGKIFKQLNFNQELYDQKIKEYLEDGPDVYELFSIVVHSGSALGGHYYAYIKSLDDLSWYCFNDSSVTKIEVSEIKKIFGGSIGFSSTTGYVLVYRKLYTSTESISFTHEDYLSLINEELKKEIEQENTKIKEEEQKWKEKLSHLTLKVFLHNEFKHIGMKKTDTVNEFKRRILIEFNLENKYDLKDVKLRGYNQIDSKSGEYYDEEESTLEDSYVISYKIYTLEFRNPSTGGFPLYDPNEITLYIYPWSDENENKSERELPFDVLKVNNRDTINELRRRICETYGYENIKDLIIFRKHEFSSSNISVSEIMKHDEDQHKEIYRYPVVDNTKLFIELKNEGQPPKFYSLLTDKISNVSFRFNFPVDLNLVPKNKITVRSYKLDNEIVCKKGFTIRKVKEIIGEFINLNVDEFIIRKHNHNGEEIRNLKETVNDLVGGIISSICIYVELGKPLGEDELNINIIFCKEDYTTFKFFPYKLTEVGIYLIKKTWTVQELKNKLVDEIINKTGENIYLDHVLIRDCVTDRPAKIYGDELILQDLNFCENKKVIVHEYIRKIFSHAMLDISSILTSHVQVCVRFWDRTNWILMEPFEILISKKSKLVELYNILSEIYPSVKGDNLFVYKIINGFNTYMDDVNKFQFVNLHEKLDMDCDSFPFFLSLDGNLLIVTDYSQDITEPSDEAREYYCRPTFKINQTCTALVLVDNKKDITNLSQNKPKNRVEEMIQRFESNDLNFKDKLANNFGRYKEKGVIIKVKKNQIEESIKNENDEIVKKSSEIPKVPEIKNILREGEKTFENVDFKSENKNKIDFSDYTMEPDEEYLEPLI